MNKTNYKILPEKIISQSKKEIETTLNSFETDEQKVDFCNYLLEIYKELIFDLSQAQKDWDYLPPTEVNQKSSFYKDRQELYFFLTSILNGDNKHKWFKAYEEVYDAIDNILPRLKSNLHYLKYQYKHYSSLLLFIDTNKRLPSFEVKSYDMDIVRIFESMIKAQIIKPVKNSNAISSLFKNKKGNPFNSTSYDALASKLSKEPSSNSEPLFKFVKEICSSHLKEDRLYTLQNFIDQELKRLEKPI